LTTSLFHQGVWSMLTQATKASSHRSDVAVAYFGQGASRLLPLRKGSRLVVNASEAAVRSGQTHPNDLIALQNKGVRVYSVGNLHAKVFLLGNTVYIGSANVSNRSADRLVEAVIRTTDKSALVAARQFVRALCLQELTPTVLRRLQVIYRPPLIPGEKSSNRKLRKESDEASVPRVLFAHNKYVEWSDQDDARHDAALNVAKRRREHPRSFELTSFNFKGKCPYRRGDVVVETLPERQGIMFSAPANVLHVRSWSDGSRVTSFIYMERPIRPRRSIRRLAKQLGRGAMKRLHRNGLVRDKSFGKAILNSLER
jgi:hypothetical protein